MAKRIGRDNWIIEGRTYTYIGAIRELTAFQLLGIITEQELNTEIEFMQLQELNSI